MGSSASNITVILCFVVVVVVDLLPASFPSGNHHVVVGVYELFIY